MNKPNDNKFKIIGTIAPLFVSCVLLAAQWGSVTNQMGVFEKTQEKQTDLIEKTNDALVGLKTDISYIKGQMKKETPSQ